MNNDINIIVTGPDKSGKGYIMAAIARHLENIGCVVTVQSAEMHNAPKMIKSDEEIAARLKDVSILITEMQTAHHSV